ncbi:MAG: malonyl-ACP O-methyltransferase BioC [Chlorobiaceae bacterium]|nr:malonyl-ACP O-methyltransferase BioC [Chlorobiaceae bacterium]
MRHRPDKKLVGSRFGRALHTYRRSALVQHHMAGELLAMIERAGMADHVERVLEFGCGSAILTSLLLRRFSVGTYFANDLVEESRDFVSDALSGRTVGEMVFLQGDFECLEPLPVNLDLVVSNATVQWFHDLPGFFSRMADSIRPGGLLVFSTFSTGNMKEIAQLGEASLSYLTLQEIADLAGERFEPVGIGEEERRQEFASPEAMLRHIRDTGVNGLSRQAWTRTRYHEFMQRYRSSFSSGSGVYLTYHPVYCCFRRKGA